MGIIIFIVKKLRMNFLQILPDRKSNKSLWAIAWMCFFWSMASLMVFSLLPTFIVDELNASTEQLGIIEGIAIFLAFTAKFVSGISSDIFRTRKPIIILGTSLSVVIKVMFALATSFKIIFFARAIDRFSKGIRSGPTDALIADLSPKSCQGASYGTRQTLYTMGSVAGGITAALLFNLSHNYRLVFWCSIIPASFALLILLFFVKQPKTSVKQYHKRWHVSDIKMLPKKFWALLAVIFLLMLARFSDAFLNLRARELGWEVESIPLLIVLYDIIHAFTAYPIGRLSDKKNRQSILLIGIIVLIATNILLISANSKTIALIGIGVCGLHMGITQGILSAIIAENTLDHLKGTAFAMYYCVVGLAVLIGNPIAGYLSKTLKSVTGAFWGGLFFTSCSAILLIFVIKKIEKHRG